MPSRTVALALVGLLGVSLVTACSHATSGKGARSSAPATSTAAPVVATGFTPAWTWPPPTDDDADVATVRSIAQDDDLVAALTCTLDSACSVTALKESTGVQAWTTPLTGTGPHAVSVAGSTVLVLSGSTLSALAAADGAERWHDDQLASTSGSDTAPAVAGSDVVVLDRSGTGVALVRRDVATGKVRSSTALGPDDGTADQVVVTSGTAVLSGSVGLTGRALDTGRVLWSRTGGADSGSTSAPQVAGRTVVTRSLAGALTVIDAVSGRTAWTATLSDSGQVSVTPAAVLVADGDQVTARDSDSGRTRWTQPTTAVRHFAARPDGRTLVGCSEDVVSVRAADAALLAIAPATGGRCALAPLVGDLTPNGGVMVTDTGSGLAGYDLTVAAQADPVTDPSGAWGAADPATCAVSGPTTSSALTAAYGGTWTLTSADPDGGGCVWAQGGAGGLGARVLLLTSAADVAAAGDPESPQSYCSAPYGGTGGRLSRTTVPGLPAGNLVCSSTGWTVLGAVAGDDEAALVPRASGGTVLLAIDGLATGQAADASQQDHLRSLLTALAAT